MNIETINPANGQLIKRYRLFSKQQLQQSIESAHRAYLSWQKAPFDQRAQMMHALSQLLKKDRSILAARITEEMGKPIMQSAAEIDKCASICRHYAEFAEQYLQTNLVETEQGKYKISYQAQGIVFSITPWNFPFWQVFRAAVANIMAGNVVVLSHAPICIGSGIVIEQCFSQAGFPSDVFSNLVIDNKQAEQIIADPRVIGVSLTGSDTAGRAVASIAGKHLKKSVLELGGSDPYVILADSDIEKTAMVCVQARMMVCGQVCISPKRLIVVDEIYSAFEQAALKQIKKYIPSQPTKKDCQIGPMARADLRQQLAQQVKDSIAQGAKCLHGGNKIDGDGFYYQPTLLSDVTPGMPAYQQEMFGPVVTLIRAKDEADAIAIANDSDYGLGGGVFTADTNYGEEVARQINAGCCAINTTVSSDPRLPFGGIKQSGYGRECGAEGIRAFVNIKTTKID